MRQKNVRDTLLERYTPSVKITVRPSSAVQASRGATLEEFYREVDAKHAQSFKCQFQTKDAAEIESIMRNNRKLIEAKRHPSK